MFLGRRWRFRWVSVSEIRGKCGECDAPTTKGKEIRVLKSQADKEELETLIHEGLHACDWHKDEEWVEDAARDIARFVYAQGWRRNRE
jgi:hypothetical protein